MFLLDVSHFENVFTATIRLSEKCLILMLIVFVAKEAPLWGRLHAANQQKN